MSTILGSIVKGNTDIDDQVIAGVMMDGAKSSAGAYLNATLISTTPELRAVYSSSLNQLIGSNAAINELSVNKGWTKPYDPSAQQLSEVVAKSNEILD
ncbi:spore coat protein CotF [Clostridium acetobutylicum]|uniref:Spore coat protein F (CotF) family protein n=1 Tax=Clostridium acetobutylicum (strain ATCC 824 / DSM 792 / JCM 1419 / IAM 19013 / LMG 5710 / NBRC 13948 / NRRL B-527 / VKM B-1787 / 2291 / W) TaxID=272562 RepID=Q97E03_CLOAB|nr:MULTISPECIES: spore coat protein [Clostridium]AAK81249.1 Spore coat protein F (CotF) family protein [Clostridium acetobutylicum ATCC 824]ADZ22357.1 Spore coat protein F (CotF) family protein [Clostridium acetobutylicum EA 2018]AEI32765.1 spore coat protein F (cotf) family protein [Clostridium acetobutylicum DSM 1731]AWV81081.1 spore coat protein [Clostridium acetobutylicum]KHD36770.1 spore coat protein [Clostridium acetobutylicum]